MDAKNEIAFLNYFRAIIHEEIERLGLGEIVNDNILDEDAVELVKEVDGKGLDEATIIARFKREYGIWIPDPDAFEGENSFVEPESFDDIDEMCDPETAQKIKSFFGDTVPYQFAYFSNDN